jgi:hypothetical protein
MFSKPIREMPFINEPAPGAAVSENYYSDFNKYILTESAKPKVEAHLSYADYMARPNELKKYKLPELKSIAKSFKLHVSGNKSVVIERIESYFNKITSAIKIQKCFRGHLVRYLKLLHGPALNNRGLCVNATDFYTLEPLEEIDDSLFFSYRDDKDFIYGFDVTSLMNIFKRKNGIMNPYNREELEYKTLKNIFSLYKIGNIVNGNQSLDSSLANIALPTNKNTPRPTNIQIQRPVGGTIETRIQELFMTIDRLGNYTNSTWFSNLEKSALSTFYFSFHAWWSYGSRLPASVKRNICPNHTTILFQEYGELSNYMNVSFERYRIVCLDLMEKVVYNGIDIENQRLGALHVLCMLTKVSREARETYYWLYETTRG